MPDLVQNSSLHPFGNLSYDFYQKLTSLFMILKKIHVTDIDIASNKYRDTFLKPLLNSIAIAIIKQYCDSDY